MRIQPSIQPSPEEVPIVSTKNETYFVITMHNCHFVSHELSSNKESTKWFDKGSSEMWLMGSISRFASSYFPNSNVSQ